MKLRTQGFAVLATALLATSSFAQTNFPEVEPNSVKAEATAVTGIVAGDTITGVSTGTSVTVASTLVTTSDVFRVKTAALPLGIYRHRLTLTTSTTTGHTGTIRGLNQTGVTGTASTGGTPGTTDSIAQTASTTSVNPPPRTNQWYGFGKQEELYYRVQGTTATTAAYTATMSTSTVPFTVIAPSFEASGPITISTIGLTTQDTELHVYDSNLDAIAGFSNDDEGPVGATVQSRLARTYAPGIYFVAVSRDNTSWSLPSPADDDSFGIIMDFPGVLVCNSTLPTTAVDDRDFRISGCNGTVEQSNQVAFPDSFSIQWFMFTVANGAPPIVPANDNCASAIAFAGSGSHVTALGGATNDGAASCDPGGITSKDVWYSINGGLSGGVLSVNTCGTTVDTCVSVHNSCGGADVACNDDCGGFPCVSTSSCVSGITVAPNQVFLIRVSDKGLGGCGEVTTTIILAPQNDDCSTPIVLPGPGVYAFNTSSATTGPQGQGLTVACATTGSVKKDLWYTYTATVNGTVNINTCNQITSADNDTKISYYAGPGCPAAASPIGCDDDSCVTPALATDLNFAVSCGQVFSLQVGNFSATTNIVGTFTLTETGTTCSTPSTPECIGDTAAACPCSGAGGSLVPNPGAAGNGCANNSFPNGANLSSSGVAVDNAGDTLVLTCSGMPGPGLFIQSNALAGPFVNFNDGILCAAIGIIRMGVVFPDAFGVASYPGGLTPNPIHIAGSPVLLNGSPTPETKHYQCWYRDITPGFCNSAGHNMSNGLAIVWAP